MKYYLLLIGNSYVTLYQNDELNSFPKNEYFYDLSINKSNATKFSEFHARNFLKVWSEKLKPYNIRFGIKPC